MSELCLSSDQTLCRGAIDALLWPRKCGRARWAGPGQVTMITDIIQGHLAAIVSALEQGDSR